MAALAADRATPSREGRTFSYPVKGATTLYAGALVCLNATGYLVPGAVATTLVAVGRSERRVANAGADGAVNAEVRPGVFRFNNSASTDAITAAEIGDDCYIVDDQTVAKTDGTTTRSKAGKIVDVDSLGVWVKVGI